MIQFRVFHLEEVDHVCKHLVKLSTHTIARQIKLVKHREVLEVLCYFLELTCCQLGFLEVKQFELGSVLDETLH